MKFLLDTCVISDLAKLKPSPAVVAWINSCPEERLFLSSLTIGELHKGISRLPPSDKKENLQHWLNIDLQNRFAGRIIPLDIDVAQTWGHIQGIAEKDGKPMPVIDALIAATALTHDLTVVTRNTLDMEPSCAKLFNPWKHTQ